MTNSAEEKVEWTEESFYFGSANWPSEATYRHSGDRLQVRIDLSLRLHEAEGGRKYLADIDRVPGFMATYIDCQLQVSSGYVTNEGRLQAPSLWLFGWQEVTDEAGRRRYEEDKRVAWK